MIPDVECVRVVTEILDSLDLSEHVIKINHRKILDGLFEACGVPDTQFRAICSSVDKLDKVRYIFNNIYFFITNFGRQQESINNKHILLRFWFGI